MSDIRYNGKNVKTPLSSIQRRPEGNANALASMKYFAMQWMQGAVATSFFFEWKRAAATSWERVACRVLERSTCACCLPCLLRATCFLFQVWTCESGMSPPVPPQAVIVASSRRNSYGPSILPRPGPHDWSLFSFFLSFFLSIWRMQPTKYLLKVWNEGSVCKPPSGETCSCSVF